MSVIKGTNQIVAGFGGTKRSIGEVYFSQSSLATDNSGALPLFTGETIASANTIYPDFYNWVLAHTELQCTSAEYESALSTYGECPKYVISSGSLRLPKLSNYIKAANTSEGITQKEAGLPNITGDVLPNQEDGNTWTLKIGNCAGAFSTVSSSPYAASVLQTEQNKSAGIRFDASRSSSIYGKSSTVTPASTTLYPWVVAYTAAIPASTAQAAEFQQGLNSKVSKTGDTMTGALNVPTAAGSENSTVVANTAWVRSLLNGVPTTAWVRSLLNEEISKMLGRMNFNAGVYTGGKSYVCPSDGYLFFISSNSSTTISLSINNISIGTIYTSSSSFNPTVGMVPVSKDDIFGSTDKNLVFSFVPQK